MYRVMPWRDPAEVDRLGIAKALIVDPRSLGRWCRRGVLWHHHRHRTWRWHGHANLVGWGSSACECGAAEPAHASSCGAVAVLVWPFCCGIGWAAAVPVLVCCAALPIEAGGVTGVNALVVSFEGPRSSASSGPLARHPPRRTQPMKIAARPENALQQHSACFSTPKTPGVPAHCGLANRGLPENSKCELYHPDWLLGIRIATSNFNHVPER